MSPTPPTMSRPPLAPEVSPLPASLRAHPDARLRFGLALAAATVSWVVALVAQYALGQQPCALCVLQRFALAAVLLAALAGLARPLYWPARVALFAGAAAGAGTAGWQLWTGARQVQGCSFRLEMMLSELWPVQALPALFAVRGDCDARLAPILGLTIVQWSLLLFVALAVLMLVPARWLRLGR